MFERPVRAFVILFLIVVGGGGAFLYLQGGSTCVNAGYREMSQNGNVMNAWDSYNRCRVAQP